MSANIYYRAVKPKESESLEVSCPSLFLIIMSKCFVGDPFKLETKDIPVLQGMLAAAPKITSINDENVFQVLIDEIERKDAIEVWAEY